MRSLSNQKSQPIDVLQEGLKGLKGHKPNRLEQLTENND